MRERDLVEKVARMIAPEIHEKYDRAYARRDFHDQMRYIGELTLSRERAAAVIALLSSLQDTADGERPSTPQMAQDLA